MCIAFLQIADSPSPYLHSPLGAGIYWDERKNARIRVSFTACLDSSFLPSEMLLTHSFPHMDLVLDNSFLPSEILY